MLVQKYKDMLSGKSVIRQLSEFATARGQEIGYENVFDYSLGNPSVPVPREFTDRMIHMLATKEPLELHGIVQASVLQVSGSNCGEPGEEIRPALSQRAHFYGVWGSGSAGTCFSSGDGVGR